MELCDKSRFSLIEKIGHGGYSTIYTAKDLSNGKEVIVKMFKDEDISHYRELEFLSFCSKSDAADFFPKPIAMFYSDDCANLVLEKFEGDAGGKAFSDKINEWSTKAGNRWSPELKTVFINLLKALDFLHSNKIYHRDVSYFNILFSEGRVVLSDLGLAKRFVHPANENFKATAWVTNQWFRAPEVFSEDGIYDEKIDIWSLGIVFFYFLTGETYTKNVEVEKIEEVVMEAILDFPLEVKTLIGGMIKTDPRERWSARDLLRSISETEWQPSIIEQRFRLPYIANHTLPARRELLESLLGYKKYFGLTYSSIFTTLLAFDIFLDSGKARKERIPLYACACAYICSAYYDNSAPDAKDFASVFAYGFKHYKLDKALREVYSVLGIDFFNRISLLDVVRARFDPEKVDTACEHVILKYFLSPNTLDIEKELDSEITDEGVSYIAKQVSKKCDKIIRGCY